MIQEEEGRESSVGTWFSWIAVTVIGLVIGGFVFLKLSVRRSLHRADCITLTETVRRWKEAGGPSGEKLVEFMQGRRSDMAVSNRLFTINRTNYATLLALTRPSSKRIGTLFVTTNGILIWLDSGGNPKIAEFGGTPRKSPPLVSE